MTVYALLMSNPQGEYDVVDSESKILYMTESQTLIFMAVDEREHPGILNVGERDGIVSELWREYVLEYVKIQEHRLCRLKGCTMQVVPSTKIASLLTRQGEYADV